MPDSRHAAARALCALAADKVPSVNEEAGSNAGISSGGTTGACRAGVVTGCCEQCAEHKAGDCSACTIGIPSQCAAIAAARGGMSALEHTYAARAVCWNSSATAASKASRSRLRRVVFMQHRMAEV